MSPATEKEPLVSVVTVCLDARDVLGRAMDSVLAQSYGNLEYHVVDGGSSDDTRELLAEYEPRFQGRLTWTSEPDRGLYDAMNKGVARAKGRLVGTLNADDAYEPAAVALAVEAWRAHPDAGVVYGDLRTVDASGVTRVRRAPETVDVRALRRGMVINHPATFVSAEAYEQVGTYDTRYPIAADYDFILRCAESNVRFVHLGRVLADFSIHGVSSTRIRATDRDETRVRIAHGVSPVVAWARYCKRAGSYAAYRLLERIPGFRGAYDVYKGRGDDVR